MPYRVLATRPAQIDTHQATHMTRQLGSAGGIRPPTQRTLLGHSEDYGGRNTSGHYSSSGGMQVSRYNPQPKSKYF